MADDSDEPESKVASISSLEPTRLILTAPSQQNSIPIATDGQLNPTLNHIGPRPADFASDFGKFDGKEPPDELYNAVQQSVQPSDSVEFIPAAVVPQSDDEAPHNEWATSTGLQLSNSGECISAVPESDTVPITTTGVQPSDSEESDSAKKQPCSYSAESIPGVVSNTGWRMLVSAASKTHDFSPSIERSSVNGVNLASVSSSSSISEFSSDEEDEFDCRNVVNTSKQSIDVFKGFVHPKCSKPLQRIPLALRFLMKLRFSKRIKLFDLSTPLRVRLVVNNVLDLLTGAMKHHPIEHVDEFILPNIKMLNSAEEAMQLLDKFITALGSLVNKAELRCDEVYGGFKNDVKQRDRTTNFRVSVVEKTYLSY